jgi:hypothetical protein
LSSISSQLSNFSVRTTAVVFKNPITQFHVVLLILFEGGMFVFQFYRDTAHKIDFSDFSDFFDFFVFFAPLFSLISLVSRFVDDEAIEDNSCEASDPGYDSDFIARYKEERDEQERVISKIVRNECVVFSWIFRRS